MLDIDFYNNPDKLKREYLDMYKGVQTDVLSTTRFDESLDLSTTYLGRTDVTREMSIKAEKNFAVSEQSYMVGKLFNETECQILLDVGASKSYMSKSYYLHCKSLYSLPNFTLKTEGIYVENGQYVGMLFIIQIVTDIHGHGFEVFTLVSEIHENVDLVLGIKNIFELKGIINS